MSVELSNEIDESVELSTEFNESFRIEPWRPVLSARMAAIAFGLSCYAAFGNGTKVCCCPSVSG